MKDKNVPGPVGIPREVLKFVLKYNQELLLSKGEDDPASKYIRHGDGKLVEKLIKPRVTDAIRESDRYLTKNNTVLERGHLELMRLTLTKANSRHCRQMGFLVPLDRIGRFQCREMVRYRDTV